MNVSAFLPLYIYSHPQIEVSFGLIGLILSMFQIAYLIIYLFFEKFFKKWEPKYGIIIGYGLITVATLGYASLFYLDNQTVFLTLSLIFRLI